MTEKRLKTIKTDAVKPPPGGSGVQLPEAPPAPERVWITLERKYRVAQYESLMINLGVAGNLEPGETHAGALRRLFTEVRQEFYDVVEVMRETEKV